MEEEEEIVIDEEMPGPSGTPSKKRRTHSPDSMDEGSNCPICFDPYTNSGAHRLTCLKCGHLFGKRCIIKWLSSTNGKKGYCPQCKTKAKLNDIRDHYCRGIKVLDTMEQEETLKSLNEEKESKKRLQIEYATLKQRYDSLEDEMKIVRQELARTRNPTLNAVAVDEPEPTVDHIGPQLTTNFLKRLEVCRDGDSRVMAFFPHMAMLGVSARQNTALFNSFGIKKVDMRNLRLTEMVPLHSEVIRDIKSDGYNSLTASFDNSMILSSMHNNTIIQKWTIGQKVWSCCFKTDESHYCFAATQNGKVRLYDNRMVLDDQHEGGPVIEVCDLQKPIINLHWVQNVSNSSGLLVTSINRCIYFAQEGSTEFRPHSLPAEGKIYSISWNNPSKHILISYGPSTNKRETVQHSLYELSPRDRTNVGVDRSFGANHVRSFDSGAKQTVMCRNILFENPKNRTNLIAAVFDEASRSVKLWDSSNGLIFNEVRLINDTLYDTNVFSIVDQHFLCLLNNKNVNIHSLV